MRRKKARRIAKKVVKPKRKVARRTTAVKSAPMMPVAVAAPTEPTPTEAVSQPTATESASQPESA